jgi:photosystem II stability/assembly factor-like uncharacterized protein
VIDITNTSARSLIVALATVLAPIIQASADTVSVSELKEQTHIHGLAVDSGNSDHLLIATHHGLYRASDDGQAELISPVQDFMGFTPDPRSPGSFFASGHPAGGGNLGFIASTDGGHTWTQLAEGVGGPVDFHQMTVSLADPKVIYGAYGELQVSRDGGHSWSVAGPLPKKLIDLAASARDDDTIYSATEDGLSVSRDAGLSWESIVQDAPVSLVEVSADGFIYAFILGRGLVRSAEAELKFRTISAEWGDRILLHLAFDPADPRRLFVASDKGEILASSDGGASWNEFGR